MQFLAPRPPVTAPLLPSCRKKNAHDAQLAAAVSESMKRPADFYNYGVDAGVTLDHIARRVKALEFRVADVLDAAAGYRDGAAYPASVLSPGRSRVGSSQHFTSTPTAGHNLLSSNGKQRVDGRGVDLEELHFVLEEKVSRIEKTQQRLISRQEGIEKAIKEITRHITSIRAVWDSTGGSGRRTTGTDDADRAKLTNDCIVLREKQRVMQTRLKALSNAVSRSCRSLSVGVSDSQHAMLLLYSWAEKVHSAFREISIQLNMGENPCPRPQIHDHSELDRVMDVTAHFPPMEGDDDF